MGLIIGFSLALIILLVCLIDDDHEKETIDQDHFIRNLDAPVEQVRMEFQQGGIKQSWLTGRVNDADVSAYYYQYDESIIGLYYAKHQYEFWQYHIDNEFNRKWLKQYVDKLGEIKNGKN